MKRMRNLLVGVLLVALAIGFTGGLRGLNTAIQATELDFSKLLSMIEPAVVHISGQVTDTFKKVAASEKFPWLDVGQEISATYWDPIGSGFIISEDGDVVTDFHVVDDMVLQALHMICWDAEMIQVKCEEVEKVAFIRTIEYLGPIGIHLGPDPADEPDVIVTRDNLIGASIPDVYDLALLSTSLPNPTRVWCGDSSGVERGDGAFVIGYPSDGFTMDYPIDVWHIAGELEVHRPERTVTEAQISNIKTKEVWWPKGTKLAGWPELVLPDGTICELHDPKPVVKEVEKKIVIVGAKAPRAICRDGTILPMEILCDFTQQAAELPELELTVPCGPVKETREFLQTDDAIDHGNSGGPIFNWSGQVIGVAVLGAKDPSSEYHTTINKAKEILGICR